MNPFVWSESYSVGNEKVDAQRRQLFDIIGSLDDVTFSPSSIAKILRQLELYVTEHFTYEESVMQEVGFDGLEEHKKQHRVFKDWLLSVKATSEVGGAGQMYIVDSIRGYLMSWLVNHILREDMKYREAIHAHPRSNEA